MAAAAQLDKFTRSRAWLLGSILVPAVAAAAGALWLATDLARNRAEVSELKAQAVVLRNESAEAGAELEAQRAQAARNQAESEVLRKQVADLEQQVESLSSQRERLLIALSSPASADAIAQVRATMADRPARERAEALFRRGQEVSRLGRADLGAQLYEAAAGEDGTYYQPMISLGMMAANRKDWKEAERWYLAAAKADPTSPFPVYDLMNLYWMLGDLAKAKECLSRLRALPEWPLAMNALMTKVDQAVSAPK